MLEGLRFLLGIFLLDLLMLFLFSIGLIVYLIKLIKRKMK